jgi:pimeloyl-ACP methyl ester carboxylesterase
MAKRDAAKVTEGGSSAPELIDPMWILKALGLLVLAALVCGYITLGLLFWQGAWQLVLRPVRTTAALVVPGVKTEAVHFSPNDVGHPDLNGWWVPGTSKQYAILYLRGGEGALAVDASGTDLRNIQLLHSTGLPVLAFDYRGYGDSEAIRPEERRMLEDGESGVAYLSERGFPTDHVIVYGSGLGAVIAAELATEQNVAAMVLDQPDATAYRRVKEDARSRILPASLLYGDRFDLATPLQSVKAPKLLVQTAPARKSDWSANDQAVAASYARAAFPRMTVGMLPAADRTTQMMDALRRFLDANLPNAR